MIKLLLISISLLFIPSASAAGFSDLRSPALIEAVGYLVDAGVLQGYEDGTFKPYRTINRAEALKIILESLEKPVSDNTDSGFIDVDPSQWFAKYVTAAKSRNLIEGYDDGTYRPGQTVNKVEFLKIAMTAQDYYTTIDEYDEVSEQFSDIDTDQWYMPYLGFAYEHQFLNASSKFKPTRGMTRGEAALIIYRILLKNEKISEKNTEECLADTCITKRDGTQIDIAKEYPELASSPYVEFVDGKMFIGGIDSTNDILTEETIKILLSGEEYKHLIRTTPLSEKVRIVDEQYQDEYKRIQEIGGGSQFFEEYSGGNIFVRGHVDMDECHMSSCRLEGDFIWKYSALKSSLNFLDFRTTNEAKGIIFDIVKRYESDDTYPY